jgi:uncharacterized protein (TIGR03083 family)
METLEYRIELCQAAAEQLTQYLQTLSAEAWCHPSACEAWEVRDVVAHLTWGAELYADALARGMQGDTSPREDSPPPGTLTRAALAARIAQRAIAYRESLGEYLLATFTARHDHLQRLMASLSPQDWETPCAHPVGLRPAHWFLTARLTELTMHAWDIWWLRDPTRPLFAASVPLFLERLPGMVARNARPDTLLCAPLRYRFAITGAVPSQHDLVLEGGTVRMEPAGTTAADVRCLCDTETFVLLMYGRLTPQTAVASGRLVVEDVHDPMITVGPWFTLA